MDHNDCRLCAPALERKIVFSSSHFSALPSLGALAPGHLLLVPKAHVIRLASVPDELLVEYARFQEETARRLEAVFEAPVHRFEHGSDAAATRIPCTIQHAHLHLLPAAADIRIHLDERWRSVEPADLPEAAGADEYLFYQPPEGHARLARGSFPSQYLRRSFAKALGVSEWNWRRDHREAVVRKTYDRLCAAKIHA
jgi:diadenosine tetraphosphate (Ap4A) HIT family hydrolase